MHVMVVQLDMAWEDKTRNRNRVIELLAASDVPVGTLVVLPEMFETGFSMNVEATAQEAHCEGESFLRGLAVKYQSAVIGGTGILAFESISRGADRAIILEMSRPAVATMLNSMETLRLSDRIEVFNVDTLRWLRNIDMARRDWPDLPWIVYCCPPYKMWTSDTQRLCQGLMELLAASPVGSRIVCESEWGFDLPAAMPSVEWDVRNYDPANISICRKD